MRTSTSIELNSNNSKLGSVPRNGLTAMSLSGKTKTLILVALVIFAFLLRWHGLEQVGLSEDEVHKLEAGRAYLRGDFTANAEHPMLMKLMVAAALVATDAWNKYLGHLHPASEEMAVRLPNLIFGSLTTVVIFLFGQESFGPAVGLLSAVLWATGVDAIAINRVAKEDTLLVFFIWLGFYFYWRAKQLGSACTAQQEKLFSLSGASFGLMLASKYFPHYMGLNFLYYHVLGRNEWNQPVRKRDLGKFFSAFAVAFVLANPALLSPHVVQYLITYVREQTVTHHGYLMMGHLYYNNISSTPGGTPFYFYLLAVLIKTPLPVLLAAIVGFIIVFKRMRKPGPFFFTFMFVLWIIPYSTAGSKWLRYTLSLAPILYIVSAIGIVSMYQFAARFWEGRSARSLRLAVTGGFVLFFFIAPLWTTVRNAPYYSLYINPLGLGRTAYYFPHDEIYDAGLREAIQVICKEAPAQARVGGETPSVFRYYFQRFGRPDLRYFNLSDPPEKNHDVAAAFVVVQDGRKYFENVALIEAVESRSKPIVTIRAGGATAAKVYRVDNLTELRQPR